MGIRDFVLAPWRLAGVAGRALDDLHAIADHARREPDPVEEARERIDVLVEELRRAGARIDDLIATASPLPPLVAELEGVAREIVTGGDELHATTRDVDRRAGEIVTGGQDLVATCERLEAEVRQLTAALPQILAGLGAVEEMEEAVETVAETVEPLQGTAASVGRLTERLSREGGRGRLPRTPGEAGAQRPPS